MEKVIPTSSRFLRLRFLRGILAVGILPWASGPGWAVDFQVGSASVLPGSVAVVPLSIMNAPTNLSAFCLFLSNAAGFGLPTVVAGPAQPNLTSFVDDFGNGIYRVTGFVLSGAPVGNGVVAQLLCSVPISISAGAYPLTLPRRPPPNAPVGTNPEARALLTSDWIEATGRDGFILVETVRTPFYLTDPKRLGNGAFQFGFTNSSAPTFSVYATTNIALPFSNWTILGVAQVSNGSFQFSDDQATNYDQRFYRVGP